MWRVEGGVGAPHDFALAAAPMPAHGTGDRALAVFIAETKATGSQLRKFIFLPEGKTFCIRWSARFDLYVLSRTLAAASCDRKSYVVQVPLVMTCSCLFTHEM